MLQACPEIHGNGAELNLYLHIFLTVRQEDGDVQDKMKAPIAIHFGIFYVIFPFDYDNIILLGEKLCKAVDIIGEGADHADSRHICQIIPDAF